MYWIHEWIKGEWLLLAILLSLSWRCWLREDFHGLQIVIIRISYMKSPSPISQLKYSFFEHCHSVFSILPPPPMIVSFLLNGFLVYVAWQSVLYFFLQISHMIWIIIFSVFFFLIDSFCMIFSSCIEVKHISWFNLFLQSSNIPLCLWTTISFSSHLSLNSFIVYICWLLRIIYNEHKSSNIFSKLNFCTFKVDA